MIRSTRSTPKNFSKSAAICKSKKILLARVPRELLFQALWAHNSIIASAIGLLLSCPSLQVYDLFFDLSKFFFQFGFVLLQIALVLFEHL